VLSGAVLIAEEEEPLLRLAYGLADRTRDLPNQVDTKLNLGSMDKVFTAVAIRQLVEQGKLAVEEGIADRLPGYPSREVAEAVTIHQLLTDTAGLGHYSDGLSYYGYVRPNILEPSGLTDTGAFERDARVRNLAIGHTDLTRRTTSWTRSATTPLGYTTIVLTNGDEDCLAADKVIKAALLP